MKTNRDEILKNCFTVFVSKNYERATITELSRACGLSRMGIHHYFPNKQAVFMAVADRYVFEIQTPENKFTDADSTLAEFIERYIEGVRRTMAHLLALCKGGGDVALNIYYLNFMMQVRQYYPGAERKFRTLMQTTQAYWQQVVEQAARSGELRPGLDPYHVAGLFHQIHFGLSFEQAFLNGLDLEHLYRQFRCLYGLIRI